VAGVGAGDDAAAGMAIQFDTPFPVMERSAKAFLHRAFEGQAMGLGKPEDP
jgi:hypothetical protein